MKELQDINSESIIVKREYIVLLIILTIIFRMVFYLIFPLPFKFPDETMYRNVAYNFSKGKGLLLDSVVPVVDKSEKYIHHRFIGYAFFQAILYNIFGFNYKIIYAAQVIIDILIVLFIFLICLKLGLSEHYSFIAAFLYSFYPINIVFTFMVVATNLFTCLSVITIYLLISNEDYKWERYMYAAFFTGLTILTRPSLQYFFLWVLFYLVIAVVMKKTSFFNAVKCGVVYLVILVIIQGAWVYRNYRITGKTFFAVNSGWMLYKSNNELATGGTESFKYPLEYLFNKMPPLKRDNFYKKAAIKWIKENPKDFLKLIPKKIYRYWNIVPNYDRFNKFPLNYLSGIFHILIYLLTLYFLVGRFKSCFTGRCYFIFSYILYFALIHNIVIEGSLRYRAPSMPFLFIISVMGLRLLMNDIREFRKTSAAPAE